MSELKPCPFCGSEEIHIETLKKFGTSYLWCKQCGAEISLYNSLDEAVSAWNGRTNNATD